MIRNTLLTFAKPILAAAALLALTGGLAPKATAGTISLSLSGMCGTDFDCVRDGYYQAGAAGLYIGNYNSLSVNSVRSERHNWIWEDMLMEIDDTTGDATITGSMVSAFSDPSNQRFGTTLGVNIALTGMSFVGDAFSQATPYDDMVEDLIVNGDLGNFVNTQGIDALQWDSLEMSFTHEAGFNRPGDEPNEIDWLGNVDDDIPLTGWQGMADTRHHCNGCVAELEMRDDGNGGKEIHFGAWFGNPTGDSKYNFADTKTKAILLDEPPAQVPEPSFVLGMLAMVGLGAWSKQQKRAD